MDLQIFNYNQKQIRTSINEKGETLFVAKDVCEVLEISKYRDAILRLDQEEKGGPVLMDTLGGKQEMATINESGLYALVLSSTKEEAKKFKRWVLSEVLPSIRKTGSYGSSKSESITRSVETLKAIDTAASVFGLTGNQKILSINRATKEITNIDFQKLLGVELVNDTQENQLTPTEIGKELGLSAKNTNMLIQQKGLQLKDVNNYWVPTLRGQKYSVLLDTAKKNSKGTAVTQLKWKQSIINELRA